jgi:hypothetical protein
LQGFLDSPPASAPQRYETGTASPHRWARRSAGKRGLTLALAALDRRGRGAADAARSGAGHPLGPRAGGTRRARWRSTRAARGSSRR